MIILLDSEEQVGIINANKEEGERRESEAKESKLAKAERWTKVPGVQGPAQAGCYAVWDKIPTRLQKAYGI